ncbi:MAG TPA: Ppx/GppA phosphatase family protein [Methanoregulaceae archaeon]|nr:Ppx/GppA phosphatase family protein [Methanoregulaceae archaeon]
MVIAPMTSTGPITTQRIVAFIDIGTNSIRLYVVRISPDCSYTVMSSQKEAVRLGEGEFETGIITQAAIDRAVMVSGRFVELARSFGAQEFVAVATSAAREAQNRYDLLSRLRHEAHLDVQVISGREEARLIYMGVAAAFHLEGRQAMIVDIGGGSTEIAIGGQQAYSYLASVRLGSIRLANIFFPGGSEKPVGKALYERIRDHVRKEASGFLRQARERPIDQVIGSSGTIINLCDISARLYHPEEPGRTVLTVHDMKKTIAHLCSLPLPERKKVPGINPERADIILAGAAVIDTFAEELGIFSIDVTQRGLQDGLLADYLSRMAGYPLLGDLSVRERSVLLTGRNFGINEYHARTVSKLALDLFDSGRDTGLHAMGERERELLEYAGFLHDIGSLISFNNHHNHSYYIIRNSDLLGFEPREVLIMANIARFHRKKLPKRREQDISGLNEPDQGIVRILSLFLRLAESLDRRHAALIDRVAFTIVDPQVAELEITARGDCQFESWGVENEEKNFERIFARQLCHRIVTEEMPGDHGLPGESEVTGTPGPWL